MGTSKWRPRFCFGGVGVHAENRGAGLRPAGLWGFKCQRSMGVRAVRGVLLGGRGVLGPQG